MMLDAEKLINAFLSANILTIPDNQDTYRYAVLNEEALFGYDLYIPPPAEIIEIELSPLKIIDNQFNAGLVEFEPGEYKLILSHVT